MAHLFLTSILVSCGVFMKKTLILSIVAVVGGYWLLRAKPDIYFNKSLEYKNFTLLARGAIPEGTDIALDNAYTKIAASEFTGPDTKFRIYLPASRNEFLFFTAFQTGDYSRVNPFTGAIFIAAADFKSDQARTAAGAPDPRVLNSEIAGAAARELVRRALKPLTYLAMSEWKLSGYSERLSGGTGAFTPTDICPGKADAPGLQEYKYGLAVDYAQRVDGLGFTELLNKDYSYEKAEAGLLGTHCGK